LKELARAIAAALVASAWDRLHVDTDAIERRIREEARGAKRAPTLQSQLKRDARHSQSAQHTQRAAMMRRSQRGR